MSTISFVAKVTAAAAAATLATTMSASAIMGFYATTTKDSLAVYPTAAITTPFMHIKHKGTSVHVIGCTPTFCHINSPDSGWVRREFLNIPVLY